MTQTSSMKNRTLAYLKKKGEPVRIVKLKRIIGNAGATLAEVRETIDWLLEDRADIRLIGAPWDGEVEYVEVDECWQKDIEFFNGL